MTKKKKKISSTSKKQNISDNTSSDSSDFNSESTTDKYKTEEIIDIEKSDTDDSSEMSTDTQISERSTDTQITESTDLENLVVIPKKKLNIKNSNEIFNELIKRQLRDIPIQWKLNINDMKRICKYIDSSIFDPDKCCIWNGYITNMNNSNKGTYVNFYFRNKKVALHRLLYSNFVAPLDSSEYLKFNCDNKGICCNINHYEKYKYSKNNTISKKKEFKYKESKKKDLPQIQIIGPDDPDKLIIDFD